jgi:hypothetical protein
MVDLNFRVMDVVQTAIPILDFAGISGGSPAARGPQCVTGRFFESGEGKYDIACWCKSRTRGSARGSGPSCARSDREPCIGKFSVVACSLEAQRVLYRQKTHRRSTCRSSSSGQGVEPCRRGRKTFSAEEY